MKLCSLKEWMYFNLVCSKMLRNKKKGPIQELKLAQTKFVHHHTLINHPLLENYKRYSNSDCFMWKLSKFLIRSYKIYLNLIMISVWNSRDNSTRFIFYFLSFCSRHIYTHVKVEAEVKVYHSVSISHQQYR